MSNTSMERAFIDNYGENTTQIFAQWETYLRKLARDRQSDLVWGLEETLARHAKERMKERKITTGQVIHVLEHAFELMRIEKSTRSDSNIFKFRVEGVDFDGIRIALIVIPGGIGYKIITAFSI